MVTSILPIDLNKPPPGLAVIERLEELDALADETVKAVTLAPKNREAARFFCENLALSCRQPTWKDGERAFTRIGTYYSWMGDYKFIDGGISPFASCPLQDDRRWQAATAEFMAIGGALATLCLVNQPTNRYIEAAVSQWRSLHKTGEPHTDPVKRRTELGFVHTQSWHATALQFGGQLYQGEPCSHTIFKAAELIHCAGVPATKRDGPIPRRPHVQASHDVFYTVPSLLR